MLYSPHTLQRTRFTCHFLCEFFFRVLNFRLSAVSLLSVANSHVALVALHSLRWCIFIWRQFYLFIFTLYDLSMWWHNKGFNEFDSLPFAALSLFLSASPSQSSIAVLENPLNGFCSLDIRLIVEFSVSIQIGIHYFVCVNSVNFFCLKIRAFGMEKNISQSIMWLQFTFEAFREKIVQRKFLFASNVCLYFMVTKLTSSTKTNRQALNLAMNRF